MSFLVVALVLCLPSAAHALDLKSFFDKASRSLEENVGNKLEETIDEVFGNEDEPLATQGQPAPSSNQPKGAPPPSPGPQYSAAEVRETQRLLTELGYNPGPIDGDYGSKTLRAILAFETDRGLRPSGVPSPEVIEHMRSALAGASQPPLNTFAAPAPQPPWPAPTGQATAPALEPAYADFVRLALRADPAAFAAEREVAGVAYRLAVADEVACQQLLARFREMGGDVFAVRDFVLESAALLDQALADLDATPSALEVVLTDQRHVQHYDFAAGGYPIAATPLLGGGERKLTDRISAPPCDAGVPLHRVLPQEALTISRVGLGTLAVELEGAPGGAVLPMAESEARAFEARNPGRTIELVGQVRLEPPVAAFGPLRGRILALEARDPGTGETLYRFPLAPEVAGAAPEVASAEAASFETAPEPSVRALLPLLMQARPDHYDTDEFAVLHDSVRISSGSSLCQETRRILQNDIARARYLQEARARLRQALAAATAGPSTKVVLISSPDSVDEYDFTRRGFPLRPYLGGAGSVLREGQLFDVPLGDRCHLGAVQGFGPSPLSLRLPVTGGNVIDFLPMAPERAEVFLGRGGRPPIRVEALVATTASDEGLSGRVVAARVVDPETREVLHAYDRSLFPQGAEVAGEDTGATASEPAPLTRFLLTLHGIRHLPQLLDDRLVLEMAERQIAYDQRRYANPAADRDYEPVFAAEKIQDRHPAFAAEELAPLYRAMLQLEAAAAPDLVRVEHELRFPDYDTATGRLRFSPFLVQDEARRQPSPLLIPAQDVAGLEQAASGRMLYDMEMGGVPLQVPWRGLEMAIQNGRLPKIRALALDRRLELDGIAVERARAEELLKVRDPRFRAAVDFRVAGAVEDPEGRGRGLLLGEVEQVQILGPGREVIANLDPDAFARLASGVVEKPTPSVQQPPTDLQKPTPALQMARLEEAPADPGPEVAPERAWVPPSHEPYGPDMVGVRLGMTVDDAEGIIRNHMDVGWVYEMRREVEGAKQMRPYQAMRLYVSSDLNDMIGVYTEPPAAAEAVVAVVRKRALGPNTLPEDVGVLLRDKYGEPDKSRATPAVAAHSWGATAPETHCSPSPTQGPGGLALVEGQDPRASDDPNLQRQLMQQVRSVPVLTMSDPGTPPVIDRWATCGPVLTARIDQRALRLFLVDHSAYAQHYRASFASVREGGTVGTTAKGDPPRPDLKL